MLVMGIESSCDETSVAIVEDGRKVLSVETLSQIDIHAVYGGVVPEIASRKHLETIYGLADRALQSAGVKRENLGAVAVTNRPGLIGALLTGLSFAKGVAFSLGIPLVACNHIAGHLAAGYPVFPELVPPFGALSVSGGNTLFMRVRDYTEIDYLGASRDDSAGEAFDKVARVMGIPYPGGATVDRLAREGRENYGLEACRKAFPLPRPWFEDAPYDTSFSGLKTAMINAVHHAEQTGAGLGEKEKAMLAASFTEAVADMLTDRVTHYLEAEHPLRFAVGGGVAANSRLREKLEETARRHGVQLFIPPLSVCGDNAVMIASQGYYELLAGHTAPLDCNAFASLELV